MDRASDRSELNRLGASGLDFLPAGAKSIAVRDAWPGRGKDWPPSAKLKPRFVRERRPVPIAVQDRCGLSRRTGWVHSHDLHHPRCLPMPHGLVQRQRRPPFREGLRPPSYRLALGQSVNRPRFAGPRRLFRLPKRVHARNGQQSPGDRRQRGLANLSSGDREGFLATSADELPLLAVFAACKGCR
jgi:hypothetical protein